MGLELGLGIWDSGKRRLGIEIWGREIGYGIGIGDWVWEFGIETGD